MNEMMLQQQQAQRNAAPGAGPVKAAYMGSLMTSMKNPDDLSMLKTINRWEYFKEFLDFWLEGRKHMFLSAGCLVLGVVLLSSAPLLAMASFFFASKYFSSSQIQTWIAKRFGKGRAVILVN